MLRSYVRHTGLVLLLLAGLAACTKPDPANEILPEMGEFRLGHNVVISEGAQVGPFSKSVTEEEWTQAMTTAMDERFGSYDGGRYYHFGVKVAGYVVALPGIPIVASPKSVLVVLVNVWDDAEGIKLTEKPKQITVLETLDGESFIGSGLKKSKEEQMQNLSRNAAKSIQKWLLENPEWFDKPRVLTEQPETGEIDEEILDEPMALTRVIHRR